MRKSVGLALIVPFLLCVSYAGECAFPGFSENSGYFGDDSGTGSYLGVDISDVDSDRVSALKLKDEHGVEVTMVDQDAPAGKAGLKEHDVILTMNGTAVDSGAQLRRMIRETPPGRVITLGISRDGQPMTVKVQLADRKKEYWSKSGSKEFKFEVPPIPPMPPMPEMPTFVVVHTSPRSGLMVENITAQLGDYFGVKDGKGVLVRAVDKGSLAEKAGFRAGDVIVRVNDQTVHDTSDFTHAMRSRDKMSINVVVMRDKREQNLTLALPEKKDTGDLFDETLVLPEVDVDAMYLAASQSEWAQVRPQIEFAFDQADKAMNKVAPQIVIDLDDDAIDYTQKDSCSKSNDDEQEQMREELRNRLEEQREQLQEQRQELREQQQELREQIREQQEELREQQRELRQELRQEIKSDASEI
jgi:serine protease Do